MTPEGPAGPPGPSGGAARGADGRYRNPPPFPEGAGPAPPPVPDPAVLPPPEADPGPDPGPRAPVPAGHAAATFIGHSSFLLRLPDGTAVLTDPVFARRASPFRWLGPARHRPPGLTPDALPPVSAVLLSHNHYDHLDLDALRTLHDRDRPRILTGLGNGDWLAARGVPGARALDWWEAADLPGGLRATFLPMRHASARGLIDRDRTLWGGFALDVPGGGRVLFGGDSAWGPHFAEIGRRRGPFGLALLPIGAYAPRRLFGGVHMTPEEAVLAHRAVGARLSLAMHFGTFRLTFEPMDEPPRRLAAAARAAGLAPGAFRVPVEGRTTVAPL